MQNTLDLIRKDASFLFFIIEEFSNDGNYSKYPPKEELRYLARFYKRIKNEKIWKKDAGLQMQ